MQSHYRHLHAIAAGMTVHEPQAVRLANVALALVLLDLRGFVPGSGRRAPSGSRLQSLSAQTWLHPVTTLSDAISDWDRLAEVAGRLAIRVTKWEHLHSWVRASQEVSDGRKAKGAYATPYGLARALAQLTFGRSDVLPHIETVVDPSCGGGALLLAVLELWTRRNGRDQRKRAAAGLFGTELDPVPHELACLLLTIASGSGVDAVREFAVRIRLANAVTTDWRTFYPSGFDALIMNPPWESLRHSVDDEGLAGERESSEQRLVRAESWDDGLPPLFSAQGRGDRNLYKIFMELAPHLVRDGGRIGALVPAAFASDLGGTPLRRLYLSHLAVDRWTSFENLRKHFPIDGRYKFGILTATRSHRGTSVLRVRGFATNVADLRLPHATVTRDDLRVIGGDIAAIPDLTSQGEVEALRRILIHGIAFFGSSAFDGLRYRREVDMTFGLRDGVFRRYEDVMCEGGRMVAPGQYITAAGERRVPLVEGRMVGQFDPWQKSWVTGSGRTALWSHNGDRALSDCTPQFVTAPRAGGNWRVAICDVTSATNTRTVLATLIPEEWRCGNTAPVLEFSSLGQALAASAVMNSLAFDWLARRVVSGLHLNKFYLAALVWPRLTPFDVRHLAALAREVYRRAARVEAAIAMPTHADDAFAKAMSELSEVELSASIELIVMRGYGLEISEIEAMLADDRADRRGFWRFYRSQPGARRTVARVLSLLRGDASDVGSASIMFPPAVA